MRILFFIILGTFLFLSCSCLYVTSGPEPSSSESSSVQLPFHCSDRVIALNPPEGFLSVIEEACEDYETVISQPHIHHHLHRDPATTSFRNIFIEFLEEEEPWKYCWEISQSKEIRGCAGRNRIELKADEDWKDILKHEIIHVLAFRYNRLEGNDVHHHQWMSLNSLCYGFCGTFNVLQCPSPPYYYHSPPEKSSLPFPPLSFDTCEIDPVCPHRR